MVYRRKTLITASLSIACVAALMAGAAAQKQPSPPANPLVRVEEQKAAETTARKLIDYRKQVDPNGQRSATAGEDLILFGYSFFEPSRQAIQARRAYVRQALGGGVSVTAPAAPAPKSRPTEKEATPEERDAVAALGPGEKRDLLERSRNGKLSDAERKRYRLLLESPEESGEPEDSESEPEEDVAEGPRRASQTPRAKPAEPTVPINSPSGPPVRVDNGHAAPASAFHQIADPLTQMYQNVAASVPSDYQLAPGDTLVLRYWSPTLVAREVELTVDSFGAVNVPEVGRVVVRGQTAAQAERALRERMRRLYRNAEVSVTMNELRTIPVTISGESFSPGPYTVPSVATAMGMLIGTGGPTDDGTLRGIQVIRRGQVIGTLDLYRFLITGDKTSDVPLTAGDVIYIPPRMQRVVVRGEVRRPAVYELKGGESLKDAMLFAGGVKASGVDQRVQVATLQPGAARVLKDVDLRAAQASAQELFDGDAVEVFSVRAELINKVTIQGAVDQPGEYAILQGMTVADLVERARRLTSEAYPREAHLYRWNPDNTLKLIQVDLEKALARDSAANVSLSRWDRLVVYTRQEIAWTGRREVTLKGAVQKPGIYYRSDGMRVRDLLMQAGGTMPEAYLPQAVLQRQRPDGSYALEFVNIDAVLKGDDKQNALIEDRDTLAVYRSDEARFTPEHTVTLAGEAVAPGKYARGDGMKLSDLLKVAGGLRPSAGDRIVVARARTSRTAEPLTAQFTPESKSPTPDISLEDGDIVTIQGRGDYIDRPYLINVKGAVNRPGPVTVRGSNVRLSDVIKLAGGLKDEAYPEGAEFQRNPEMLATAGQKQLAGVISGLNDQLNKLQQSREMAAADIARIKAIGSATRPQIPVAVPGITQVNTAPPDVATAAGTQALFGHSLVSPPRVLTAEDLEPKGNVAVNLPAALRNPGKDDDIVMMDGDELTVPQRPTTVLVLGAVVRSSAVLFKPGGKADYYVEQSGGYAADAKKEGIVVVRLGGGLSPLKKVKALQPGDVIVVPTRVLSEKIGSRSNDIETFFRSITSSALLYLGAKKLLGL